MYQDHLFKPQEELLYRKVKDGGLGLFHIEAKARANLVSSFLETAGHPDFVTNKFHKALFDFFVSNVGVRPP